MNKLKELENKLGVKFNNIKYLDQALTHSSYANEHNCKSNETIEFLGDSVLDLCLSTYLFKTMSITEGEMTKIRATYVCEEALVVYANKLNLSNYLKLGHGEETSGGRKRQAILADAFEAVLGAIYLDLGYNKCLEVFTKLVIPYLDLIDVLDNKSKLQEIAQADKRTITYEIVGESGPSHNKTFEAIVKLEDKIVLGKGRGKTKKEAEQNAASAALSKMVK